MTSRTDAAATPAALVSIHDLMPSTMPAVRRALDLLSEQRDHTSHAAGGPRQRLEPRWNPRAKGAGTQWTPARRARLASPHRTLWRRLPPAARTHHLPARGGTSRARRRRYRRADQSLPRLVRRQWARPARTLRAPRLGHGISPAGTACRRVPIPPLRNIYRRASMPIAAAIGASRCSATRRISGCGFRSSGSGTLSIGAGRSPMACCASASIPMTRSSICAVIWSRTWNVTASRAITVLC